MPHQIRVLLAFSTAPDHKIEDTAVAVIKGLTGNTAYPTPPVTLANLQSALTAFTTAMANQVQGGTLATAEKTNATSLLTSCDVWPPMCSKTATTTSPDSSIVALRPSPIIATKASLKNKAFSASKTARRQLRVKVKHIAYAKCYAVRYAAIGAGGTLGATQSGDLFTNLRSMSVGGLTAGVNYSIDFRAVGGSTRYIDWNDAVSHMNM